MFTKFKTWVRAVVAEEVGKMELSIKQLDTTLDDERAKLVSAVSIHVKSAMNGLEVEFSKLLSGKQEEIAKMFEDVKAFELGKFKSELERILANPQGDPTHWKADSEVVKADHALRKVK